MNKYSGFIYIIFRIIIEKIRVDVEKSKDLKTNNTHHGFIVFNENNFLNNFLFIPNI